MHRSRAFLALVGGLSAILAGLVVIAVMDAPLANFQYLSVQDPAGEELAATYYPGTQPAGVILLAGFGSDQVTVRPLAAKFSSQGWHVFTFDFSGHGRSSGALGFDNAATDRLAMQVLAAKARFKQLASIPDNQVVLLGHSMGARAALHSQTFDPQPAAGCALLGCQVNLDVNIQASFFTGVADATLPWVQQLSASNPPGEVLIVTGTWDDILPPASAEILLSKLREGGGASSSSRQLIVVDNVFHNYEVYNPHMIDLTNRWAREVVGLPELPPSEISLTDLRSLMWLVVAIGLFVTIIAAGNLVPAGASLGESDHPPFAITDVRAFLRRKLVLWGPSLVGALVLMGLFFLVPIGVPVFNLIYVGFIGGHGMLLAFLYSRGKVRGASGKWSLKSEAPQFLPTRKKLAFFLAIFAGISTIAALFANSGLYLVFPPNARLIWLVIFVPFTALGFYVGQAELAAIRSAGPTPGKPVFLSILIGFVPFLLFLGLFLAIGSTSGMLGAFQGIIILTLVAVAGNFLQKVGRTPLLTAIAQGVLLQLLVLPQGVLFAVF